MSTTDRLALSRRLDWRHLFADPTIGTVAVVGRPDPVLVTALTDVVGATLVDLRSSGRAGIPDVPRVPDVVVAIDPGAADLALVLDAVARGADGHVELPTRRATLRALVAARRAGVAHVVRTCWPDATAATVRARPTDGWAQRQAAARVVHPLRRRVARIAARLGVGALTSPAACMALAPRGEAARLVPAAVAIAATAAGTEPTAGHVVLTPRFGASRHVVTLVRRARGGVVVKTPRLAHDVDEITAEHAGLAALPSAGGWPEAHGLVAADDRHWLVSSLVPGRPIDRRWARRHPHLVVAMATGWLRTLPTRPASTPLADGRDLLVREAAASIRSWCTPDGPVDAMVADTLTRWRRLSTTDLPVVLEHGDLRPPNLFRHGNRLVVVDWELARPDGLPLHDLSYLLAYLRTDGALDDSWVRHDLTAELVRLGVDSHLAGDLEAVAWMRRLASWVVRANDRTGSTVAPDEARLLESELVTEWAASLARTARTTAPATARTEAPHAGRLTTSEAAA